MLTIMISRPLTLLTTVTLIVGSYPRPLPYRLLFIIILITALFTLLVACFSSYLCTNIGHYFGIIIKESCSPFKQCIIQQPIISINKVITPVTELSDPPSYVVQSIELGIPLSFLFCNVKAVS